MRVNLGTVNVSDDFRKELRRFYGKTSAATRDECRTYLLAVVQNEIDSLDADKPEGGD